MRNPEVCWCIATASITVCISSFKAENSYNCKYLAYPDIKSSVLFLSIGFSCVLLGRFIRCLANLQLLLLLLLNGKFRHLYCLSCMFTSSNFMQGHSHAVQASNLMGCTLVEFGCLALCSGKPWRLFYSASFMERELFA